MCIHSRTYFMLLLLYFSLFFFCRASQSVSPLVFYVLLGVRKYQIYSLAAEKEWQRNIPMVVWSKSVECASIRLDGSGRWAYTLIIRIRVDIMVELCVVVIIAQQTHITVANVSSYSGPNGMNTADEICIFTFIFFSWSLCLCVMVSMIIRTTVVSESQINFCETMVWRTLPHAMTFVASDRSASDGCDYSLCSWMSWW